MSTPDWYFMFKKIRRAFQFVFPISVGSQDLTSYSLTFEGGRMKASAKRALNTGDSTDYVLSADWGGWATWVVFFAGW